MKSYDYEKRNGVSWIGWDKFAELSGALAEKIAAHNVDLVIGIARAGLFPATAVACALRREFYPIRLTRRYEDQVKFDDPNWRVDLPQVVSGKAVAIIDEIADTGRTLALAADRARELGATRVVTASLVSHSWSDPKPTETAMVSDELVIFPWDHRVYENGTWKIHPELAAALKLQGVEANE